VHKRVSSDYCICGTYEQLHLPLYIFIFGGLFPDGMIVSGLYSVFNRGAAMAMGFGDKLKTLFFQLFQTVFFVAIALIFSWIAVGLLFMYMGAIEAEFD